MAPGRSFDFGQAEQALRELPEIRLKGLFRHSSNYTFLAELHDPGCPERGPLQAVYKPARGEAPLWDFPAGTLYRREVAAYLLSRYLGWPMIPPTVVRRQAPHGIGALQIFVQARPGLHYLALNGEPADVWLEVAVFDVVTNNADRKSGHCLLDQEGRAWVIDHGLTFHVEPKLRTVIWDFAGQPLPQRLRPDLERAVAGLQGGELEAMLVGLINRRERMLLQRRLETVLEPTWRMPRPSSGWSVPWPPV